MEERDITKTEAQEEQQITKPDELVATEANKSAQQAAESENIKKSERVPFSKKSNRVHLTDF